MNPLAPTIVLALALVSPAVAAEPPVIRSARSGAWSAPDSWDLGRVPRAGDRVVVRAGHTLTYDVASGAVIRLVEVAGTLHFARDRTTRLEAGLIVVTASEEPTEDGFDCHAEAAPMRHAGADADNRPQPADAVAAPAERPSLLVGRPGAPIAAGSSATIRLHYVEGMDRASCPAIVSCGGRMEFHGEPMHLKGRYSIHFHLAGGTMRGSSVVGASIWDSHNRWITIHGTDALVVRDNVGYKGVGHGYFLESGSEVNNVLDHNLAALVLPGRPQEEQEVPFDLNRRAGFWWANSQNSFTRNVAAECAEYGYRFDTRKADNYDPVRPIRQPDGTTKR